MTDYDTRKEEQAFLHLEKMQEIAEKKKRPANALSLGYNYFCLPKTGKLTPEAVRAESEEKPIILNGSLVTRNPYFNHENWSNC